jgi:DNA polymerase III subunit delta
MPFRESSNPGPVCQDFTMPEIHYKELDQYLKKITGSQNTKGFAPVYLIYGETLLYKSTFEALLDALIPVNLRSFNYHAIDGANGRIEEVVERINTYSLLSGPRVVALCDSRIFYSKQNEGQLLEKAQSALKDQNMNQAATSLLALLSLLNLSLEDIDENHKQSIFKIKGDTPEETRWLDQIINFCKENRIPVPSGEHNADLLQSAIEKGFPKRNHLVITADLVDKRRKLFKIIKEHGVIIDCSVPKGDRRADKIAQEAVLAERMETLLRRYGKVMTKKAYQDLHALTGFDIDTFSDNLEKLIDFVGDEKDITAEDVAFLLTRTRKDPIYELTNAVSERNAERSLFFLNSLLLENFHPLQILASITNQIRKLVVLKDFAESSHGSVWHPGMPYAQFADRVMAAVQSYNKEFMDRIEKSEEMLSGDVNANTQKNKKGRGAKRGLPVTDLEIAANPYPVYKLMLNTEKYHKKELVEAIEHLSQADVRLKYTKQKPKTVLQEVIFRICNTNPDKLKKTF